PAPLRVVGPITRGGLDEGVLASVDRVDGIDVAVPVVIAVTKAERSNGQGVPVLAIGVDCRAESLFGRVGCTPDAVARARDTDPPIVSASLFKAFGPGSVLRSDAGRLPLRGAFPVPRLDAVNGGRIALFPLPVAQRLFARVGR